LRKQPRVRVAVIAALAAAAALYGASGAAAAVPLTQIGSDPFSNPQSQHRTLVEPDTFAFGSTMVAVYQSGRYFNGGASGIGFSTSTDGGASWTAGVLPGLTVHQSPPGPYRRATDPAIAYDAQHNVWLAQSLVLDDTPSGLGVVANRSTDGGLTWSNPVSIALAGPGQDFDKNWIVCDNHSGSPFYGHCYSTWDDFGDGDRLLMSTSTDGGLTWGPSTRTANNATGLGGQPVVQPNGTVIVPAANAFETAIIAFRSTNGGASWSNTVTVASTPTHDVAGNLRNGPLPTAEIDGAGRVYVAWQDCRFRRGCKVNDIVMSTSTDGLTWTAPQRVPIDSTNSGVDHFIPGLGVDPSTSGTAARLGLTYYFYRNGRCGRKTCQLEVGFIESADGGTTWSNHTDVAGPFPVTWVPDTTQGRMVGDYISTSRIAGTWQTAVDVGRAPSGGLFDLPMFAATGGLAGAAGGFVNTSKGEHPVAGAASDHASPRSAIRRR
jgi:BNR repeat-like domain